MTSPSTSDVLVVLRASHDRLATALDGVGDEQARQSSYHAWNIGQVASHLGSGAQIFTMILDAGLHGRPSPKGEDFQPIWADWNAKSPGDQASDAVGIDADFLDRVDAVSDDVADSWRLNLFGGPERNFSEFLQMRLSEHAMHTWDIAVAADPTLPLPHDAVSLLLDNLGPVASRSGDPTGQSRSIEVSTTNPERRFSVEVGPSGAVLTPSDDTGPADLTLPAEAFVRLVHGRMDAEHTPSSVQPSPDLDLLRSVFTGY